MAKKKKKLTENQLELEREVQKQMNEIYDNKDKKVKSTANIRKIIPFYAQYRGLFVALILLMIAYIFISFFEPIIAARIVEYLTMKDFDNTIRFSIYLLICGMVLMVNHYFLATIRTKLNYNMNFDLKQKMIDSIDRLSMKKIDNLNSGVLIARIESDCEKCSVITVQLADTLLSLIRALVFFIYVAFINIWIFTLLLVYIIIKYLIDGYRFGLWRKNSKIGRRRRENAHNVYFEQIKGIRDVKSLNLRDNMSKVSAEKIKYAYEFDESISHRMHRHFYFLSFPLDYLMEVLLIIIGLFLIRGDIITFASFMVVYLYKDRALSLARCVTDFKDRLTEGELSAERYFDVVERYEKETFGTIDKKMEKGEIEFKSVYFGYNEKIKVLKGINFKIEANKTTAIVGKSGSGKSTILSLIGKMYNPSKGKILIDGINLQDLTEDSLRNAIGIVNQSPYIFNSSIKNNMKYVKPDATDKEIWAALDKAQIGDFVRGLKDGLDSMVGENGVKISGGQKQRLAIARILLKGNKILVFDEATSSLDNKSQAKIVEELDKLKKDHTVVVVAHRLSTIVDADNILLVEDGKVVAEGTHSKLLKTSQTYRELYSEEENNN